MTNHIIELLIDELDDLNGVNAISIVEHPAIEENFIALKEQKQMIELAEVSAEKRILMGAALIPNKMIYRRTGEYEYHVFFSKQTIRRAAELYLMRGNQSNATLEHEEFINGVHLVESWIVEDDVHDKSRKFGMDVPVGTWMIAMKIESDEIWQNYVQSGKVKGFSIEGYFVDKIQEMKSVKIAELEAIEEEEAMLVLKQITAIVKTDKRRKSGKRTIMESFNDYPDAVSNNAARGIKLNEQNGNKCATAVGKVRAQQLAQKKPISVETIKRMASYLSRAAEYYNPEDTSACGTISFLLWGGEAGLRWAESKLKELEQ